MIDIVFNGRFASTLTEYDKLRQVNRQVLALPMYLGLGDISQGTFIENRQTVYKIQYAHQENSEYHTAQAVQNLRNALKLLDEAIARNEPLRAWWSDDVNDYCGFYGCVTIWKTQRWKCPASKCQWPLSLPITP